MVSSLLGKQVGRFRRSGCLRAPSACSGPYVRRGLSLQIAFRQFASAGCRFDSVVLRDRKTLPVVGKWP
jgi:hypothetical protein